MARIALIAAALAVALLTGWAVQKYVDRRVAATETELALAAAATVEVLVAARDLPLGYAVQATDLEWKAWPEDGVDSRYFSRAQRPTALTDFVGATVRQPVIGGEPITAGKLIDRGKAGTLAALLEPGMRAVSLQVTIESGISGFILPGDRIDLILTQRISPEAGALAPPFASAASETIVENVRVLAIDQSIAAPEENAAAAVAKSVTVEVTPEQAEALALAKTLGTLSLSLRNAFGDQTAASGTGSSRADGTRAQEVSNILRGASPTEIRILTAKRDLPAGTLLREDDVEWRPAQNEVLYDTHFIEGAVQLHQIRGNLLTRPVRKGGTLTREGVLSPIQAGFLPRALGAGMRAVSVSLDNVSGVGGLVSPGDRVDLLLTVELDPEGKSAVSPRRFGETIAENVRVLTADQSIDLATGRIQSIRSVTLELTPKQAEAVALATSMGQLMLALRPPSDDRMLTLSNAKLGLPTYTTDGDVSRVISAALRGETLSSSPYGMDLPNLPPPPPVEAVEASLPAAEPEPMPAQAAAEQPAEPIERIRIKVYRASSATYVEPGR